MIKILIAEDEKPISDLIKLSLLGEGYACICEYDGKAAADRIENESFDLVLLDIMLPNIDGFTLLEYIKQYSIPVIFLTAKTDVSDRVRGLRAGAEDYISKPFEILELLARVETVLRRYGKTSDVLKFGNIEIDQRSRVVRRDGKAILLTAKEFDLLVYFVRNRGTALYRSQIYSEVWESDEMGSTRTVDLHVQRLRRKLGLQDTLVPVYKIGYRLEA